VAQAPNNVAQAPDEEVLMIIVRFPSGFSIQYNDAFHVKHYDTVARLTTCDPDKPGSKWIADITKGTQCIIEVVRPCAMTNPAIGLTVDKALDLVLTEELRRAPSEKIIALKRKLAKFDSRNRSWK
jgi:hypothetical protein